ncbi:NAD(P)/FAD-dependent oxidoreductase [Anderseniella sp. Alg231-50]|uniref:NAD(P)/FAD-dependent oxidoreductase n=1 Tax=Anderseniella sp. Alg231-50 TaxID=1922226 RepID=UPI00307BB542
MNRLSIAVIGSGISALSAAWHLSRHHHVTVFERNGRLGGHSNTVDVNTGDGSVRVDTGFIVFNPASYPNLVALFDHLGVDTPETNMTFSASLDDGGYEYSGSGPRGLFGQMSNVASPRHWRMIADISRFFKQAAADAPGIDHSVSLGTWLKQNRYSEAFVHNHLTPMAAAIWSTPSADVLDFPAASFMRFFANHGLLKVRNRPSWRTVAGGSRQYVQKLVAQAQFKVRTNSGITGVSRMPDGVTITDCHGGQHKFDHVVIGTHADEALAMLDDADATESNLLGKFGYSENLAVLHTDPVQMPKRRRLWSSWNYIERPDEAGENQLTVSYWMNSLQPLRTDTDLFVTLNPAGTVEPASVLRQFNYTHPVFNTAAMDAQQDLWDLQGRRRTWFCGSYFGYGFHEDALQSGLAVAEDLTGCPRPWVVENPSGRIHRKSPALPEPVREAAE